MITNERQYRITRAEIKRFEEALTRAKNADPQPDVHPALQKAMIDGIRSQLSDLRADARAYEALRAGKVKRRVLSSLLDLPAALIEGRIARRFTQKQLAEKLGIAEQQLQRYEGNRYAGVSVERLQEIMDALGIQLKKTIEFNIPQESKRSAPGPVGVGRAASRSTARGTASKAGSKASTSRGRSSGRRTMSIKAGAASASSGTKSAKRIGKNAGKRKGGKPMAHKKTTGKAAARAASKVLRDGRYSKRAKRAAGSALSQRQSKRNK